LLGSAKISKAGNQDDYAAFFQPSGIVLVIISIFAKTSLSAANAKSTAAVMPWLMRFRSHQCFGNFGMAN
jgi:hypothetical protein